ncbi:hypothetical protein BCR44DRAFT_1271620 [Catenaria anguillulae PL171]|uniref:F-box domain-containing protein n=1 Tax=Catenaria anguillulae PL171 TaxID=765915 RepID=A0A1Y2HA09_9FUNG|nr:hypothetical protein BCR44DRAFT_1271620 [Catenaria anguillulae PL171]
MRDVQSTATPTEISAADGNDENAGHFRLLSTDLLLYLLDHAHAIDRLALGRSCKWLHSIAQQAREWRMLFGPSSALAPLTRPVLGTNSLPEGASTRFTRGSIVCLPIGRLSKSLTWVTNESQTSFRYADTMSAAPLALCPRKSQPPGVSPPARPKNVRGPCREDCDVCWPLIVGNDSLKLPLFINADHFESTLPFLNHQLVSAVLEPLPRPRQFMSGQGNPSSDCKLSPPIPCSIITTFFPQLVRNTVAHLVLSAHSPSINDLEALVQVHMVWRAYIHHHALDSPSWIRNKIQAHVNQLNRGGIHARAVPLAELVALLHVSTDRELTWAKIGQRVVEENTIRLFEYVRACDHCTAKLKDPGMDKIGESILRLADKVAQARADGYGFVPWQILLFYARFLRATSRIPTMGPLDSFTRVAGRFGKDGQCLAPGPLARLLHTYLDRDIRPRLSGLCATWSRIWRGLGAVPMQLDALTKWLNWCDTQVNCRRATVRRVTPQYPHRLFCDICPLPPRTDIFGYHPCSGPTLSISVRYSTSSSTSQPDHYVSPDLTYIALNRHGALLYAHSNRFNVDGTSSGFFTNKSFSHRVSSSFDSDEPEAMLHLDSLDSRVAYVAVIAATTHYPQSIVHSYGVRSGFFNDEYDRARQVRNKPSDGNGTLLRLSVVCCRGLVDKQWDFVRATAVPRYGGWARCCFGRGEHLWVVDSQTQGEQEQVGLVECVKVVQEWVVEYVEMCQANGLNSLGTHVLDHDSMY